MPVAEFVYTVLLEPPLLMRTACLDELLPSLQVASPDFVKIDVQGFGGHVIAGLKSIIRMSPWLMILTEFWPYGRAKAGTDPEQYLDMLESLDLRMFELAGNNCVIRPLADKKALIARNLGRKYTGVVAVNRSREAPLA